MKKAQMIKGTTKPLAAILVITGTLGIIPSDYSQLFIFLYFTTHNQSVFTLPIISLVLFFQHHPPQELTALFQPFSMCEDYINPPYLKAELSKCILRAMRFVHDLSDDDMKDKEVNEYANYASIMHMHNVAHVGS